MSPIQTLKQGCLTRAIGIFMKWLSTAVNIETQLKCVKFRGALKIIKKMRDGRLTFWETAQHIFINAVFVGLRYFIIYQFVIGGCFCKIFVSVVFHDIEDLVNHFV